MSPARQSDAERLVAALDREIRSRGHGAVTEASAAVGRQRSWWNQVTQSGDLKLSQWLGLLRHLRRDPVLFLRRVLGANGDWEMDRPRGEAPELVKAAWERFHEGSSSGDPSSDPPGDRAVGEHYLETLDRQRYDQPEEVLANVAWAAERADPSLLPAILGVAGSAWRMRMDLDRAEHCLQAGMAMAEELDDDGALARLVQRLSYVLADRGDRRRALRMAERAAVLYVRAGDETGLAKATVDQGVWLYYLGRYEASIRACRSGLERLREEEIENRFTAFQYLGLNLLALEESREALENLEEAADLLPTAHLPDCCRIKLDWSRAMALGKLDEFDKAAELLARVVDEFREVHPGEAVRAACDLAHLHLRAGHPEGAYEVAKTMLPLLEPLDDHAVLSAAISDLVRGGVEGLSLALVERVRKTIEDERQDRSKWRKIRSAD